MITKYKFIFFTLLLLAFSLFIYSENLRNKTFKVGVYENPPKIFTNDNKEPEGIFIDILKSIGKKENLKFEYINGKWEELLEMLKKGEIDILPDVAYSEERDSLFNFHKINVLNSWIEAFTLKNNQINSINELNNKKIGVLKGSIQEKFMNEQIKLEFKLNYTIIAYDDYASSIQALKNGEIDYLVANRFLYFSDYCDNDIIPTGIIFKTSELYFAFSPKVDNELINIFDKNLSLMKNNPKSDFYKSLQFRLDKDKIFFIPIYVKYLVLLFFIILIIIIIIIFIQQKIVIKNSEMLNQKNEELINVKEQIHEKENLIEIITNNIPNIMIYQITVDKNKNRKFTYISKSVEKFYGYTENEVKENPNLIYDRVHEDDRNKLIRLENEALENFSLFKAQLRIKEKDNTYRWSEFISKPRILKDGSICFEGIEFNITELKETEEKIKKALNEKEILIRELFHRTKNTLQVIRSLLILQKEFYKDNEELENLIKSTDMRIATIALVHQILYKSQNLSKISVYEFINELSSYIYKQYSNNSKNISISLNIENIYILIDIAIPLGLILCELITNSLKFAFTEKNEGEIKIELKKIENGNLLLTYSDNGKGFSDSNENKLGAKLINIIAEIQLEGKIFSDHSNGTFYQLEFKDNTYYERI